MTQVFGLQQGEPRGLACSQQENPDVLVLTLLTPQTPSSSYSPFGTQESGLPGCSWLGTQVPRLPRCHPQYF